MRQGGPNESVQLHERWRAQDLQNRLGGLLPGLTVEVLAHSASTNSDLLQRARVAVPTGRLGAGHAAGAPPGRGQLLAGTRPCLLVAEHQTAGRGRMGREWHSAPDASLTFSLALALAPLDWSGLSLAVGVALAEALQPATAAVGVGLGLKWPNDLWLYSRAATGGGVCGRKLGGVLIETLAAGQQRLAVVGIGINIAPLAEPLAAELSDRTGCLHEIDPHATAPGTLARLALPLVQALKTFEREGFAAFAGRYAGLDMLRDEAVVSTYSPASHGIARGVDGQGGLRIETATGIHTISSGEVSVRPSDRRRSLAVAEEPTR